MGAGACRSRARAARRGSAGRRQPPTKAIEIDPKLADAHLLLAAFISTPTGRRGARRSWTRCSRSIRRSLEAHAMLARDGLREGRQGRRSIARSRQLSRSTRRTAKCYRHRWPNRRRATIASTKPRRSPKRRSTLDPTNSRAPGDLGMHLMRTGDEPRRAPRARSRVPRRSVRRRHLQPARAARHARQVRRSPRRRLHLQDAARRGAGAARVRDRRWRTTRSRRCRRATSSRRPGPILVEIFPQARRLRRPQPRPARHDRRARRLLRPRRHDGLAAGAAAGRRSAGKRRCGTSWRTSSRCRCRSSASRAG